MPAGEGHRATGKAMRGAFMETEDFKAGVARFTSKAGRA